MMMLQDMDNDMEIEKMFSKVTFTNETFKNKDRIGQAIMEQTRRARRHFVRQVWIAAASIFAVVLATTVYLAANEEFAAEGQELAICLPDGSRVEMKALSRLSYNRVSWLWERQLDFTGNGRFIVAKGEKFTVQTDFGNITVLGTEFNIETGEETLVVECYSGTVNVETDNGEQILHPNEKVTCTPDGMTLAEIEAKEELPAFLEFDQAPLEQVLDKIEEIFNVTITSRKRCAHVVYTGVLPTGSLEDALEIIMSSCNIKYTIKGNLIELS